MKTSGIELARTPGDSNPPGVACGQCGQSCMVVVDMTESLPGGFAMAYGRQIQESPRALSG